LNTAQNMPGALTLAKAAIQKNRIMSIANCEKQSTGYFLYFPASPELFPLVPGSQLVVYELSDKGSSSVSGRSTWKKTEGFGQKNAKLLEIEKNDPTFRKACRAFIEKDQMCMLAISQNFGDVACTTSRQNNTLRPYAFSISKQDIIVE